MTNLLIFNRWADKNGMVLNISKTKEMVFHQPSKLCLPPPLEGIERVQTAKLLGVIFQGSFCFVSVTHVDSILKLCSQRIFLLKQLQDQGILQQLYVIFQAIILNRITYAIPIWGPFLSAEP